MLQYAPKTKLDPTLMQALQEQNPLAMQATAGLLDNSFMLAMMEQEMAQDPRKSWAPDGSLLDREAEREIGREQDIIQDDLDNRSGEGPRQDGSGEHGALDPTAVDHANHSFWRSVAMAAEGMGMTNAARGMHHYLDNSGSPLTIDPALVLRDAAPVRDELAYHEGRMLSQVLSVLQGAPGDVMRAFPYYTPSPECSRNEFYIHRGDSEDWFFAVAGHSAWMEGSWAFARDNAENMEGMLTFSGQFHMADKYNWDQGKTVTIAGITVDDSVVGQLHKAGLAMEYPVQGVMPVQFQIRYYGPHVTPNLPDVAPGAPTAPAPDRDGGRTDPDRERA